MFYNFIFLICIITLCLICFFFCFSCRTGKEIEKGALLPRAPGQEGKINVFTSLPQLEAVFMIRKPKISEEYPGMQRGLQLSAHLV